MSPDLKDVVLPRVCGRHRNKVLASLRRRHAAETMGYQSRGTVHHIVQKALKAAEVESVDEHRDFAHARLMALLTGVWEAALSGDIAASRVALRIVQTEIRLLGLDLAEAGPGSGKPDAEAAGKTVVMSADELEVHNRRLIDTDEH